MIEQVRLCAVWPMENRLDYSLNQIQNWTTVRGSYSCALEQGPLRRGLGIGEGTDLKVIEVGVQVVHDDGVEVVELVEIVAVGICK